MAVDFLSFADISIYIQADSIKTNKKKVVCDVYGSDRSIFKRKLSVIIFEANARSITPTRAQ